MKNPVDIPTEELSVVFEESLRELKIHTSNAEKAFRRFEDLNQLAREQRNFHSFFVSFMRTYLKAETPEERVKIRTAHREKALKAIASVEKLFNQCYPSGEIPVDLKSAVTSPVIDKSKEDSRNSIQSAMDQIKNLMDILPKKESA